MFSVIKSICAKSNLQKTQKTPVSSSYISLLDNS